MQRPVVMQVARPEALLESQFEIESVRAALQELTEGHREVLLLRFMDELDTAHIARRLGKSWGAIRALQMRGLQVLAKLMDAKDRQQVQE